MLDRTPPPLLAAPLAAPLAPPLDSPAVPRAVVRGLRREAYRLLRADARRSAFPSTLHVGRLDRWPAGVHACEVPRVPTAGLAEDVVAALLLDRHLPARPHLWLTRPGDAATDHLDRSWLRAIGAVTSAYDLEPVDLFVVTRTGWQLADHEPGQRWTRLRLVLPDA